MGETLFETSESKRPERAEGVRPKPRIVRPNRAQLELRPTDLESLLPADHRARAVWEFVTGLDLSPWYEAIEAVEGEAGRPAIDPAILMSLWVYATAEGVGSARAVERLCAQHDAYRWICGGVSVSYRTLAAFRVAHGERLQALLTETVVRLVETGLLELRRVAQDGVRVRASAGAASFRRRGRLRELRRAVEKQIESLRRELEDDPAATSEREKASRERAQREMRGRVKQALAQLRADEEREKQEAAEGKKKAKKGGKEKERRASTTDPEARVMRMADGGYRPAYNVQFATETKTQVIVGVEVSTRGTDQGHLEPMIEQVTERYGETPKEWLADGGYVSLDGIEGATKRGVLIYAPVAEPRDGKRDAFVPLPGDTPGVAAWRKRMGTDRAKAIYKERAATSECTNAIQRNRGLQRFLVRGRERVRAVSLLYALTHNVLRSIGLMIEQREAAT